MKKLFLFALSAMMICGCTDNDKEDNSVAFISLSSDALTFDAEGGESSVRVELFSSSGKYKVSDWKLTGGESWCTPSTSGEHRSISEVRFKVQANTSPNERTAAYTFTCGNVSTQLVISQKAYTMVHNPQKGGLQSVLTELGFFGAPIKSLKITGTLDETDFSVIRDMTHLRNLDIGEVDVTRLPEKAFYKSDIENIILPTNLESIGYNAFTLCHSLATLTFGKESRLSTIAAHAFEYCGLKSIEIPASMETIGSYAFAKSYLETVIFEKGSNLTTIGDYAFSDTGEPMYGSHGEFYTKSLDVDMSECTQVKELGKSAFKTNVFRFRIGTITPPKLGSEVFKIYSSDRYLSVPAESVEAYKNSAWKFYFSSVSALNE